MASLFLVNTANRTERRQYMKRKKNSFSLPMDDDAGFGFSSEYDMDIGSNMVNSHRLNPCAPMKKIVDVRRCDNMNQTNGKPIQIVINRRGRSDQSFDLFVVFVFLSCRFVASFASTIPACEGEFMVCKTSRIYFVKQREQTNCKPTT